MNPGTLFLIIYVVMAILIMTGWCQRFVEGFGLTRKGILGWLTLLVAASHANLCLTTHVAINAGMIILLATPFFCLKKGTTKVQYKLISLIILTGALCYVIREMAIINPAILLIPATWLQVAILLLCAHTLFVTNDERLSLLVGGLTLGYSLYLLRHFDEFVVWQYGDHVFFDLLWVGLSGLMALEGLYGIVSAKRRPLEKEDKLLATVNEHEPS